jgi:hypothetical protein
MKHNFNISDECRLFNSIEEWWNLLENKWGLLIGNFKQIYDYKVGIWNNQDYWSMIFVNKATSGNYWKTLGIWILQNDHNFLGTRPIFNPTCMWDLMDGSNFIYKPFNITPKQFHQFEWWFNNHKLGNLTK